MRDQLIERVREPAVIRSTSTSSSLALADKLAGEECKLGGEEEKKQSTTDRVRK